MTLYLLIMQCAVGVSNFIPKKAMLSRLLTVPLRYVSMEISLQNIFFLLHQCKIPLQEHAALLRLFFSEFVFMVSDLILSLCSLCKHLNSVKQMKVPLFHVVRVCSLPA